MYLTLTPTNRAPDRGKAMFQVHFRCLLLVEGRVGVQEILQENGLSRVSWGHFLQTFL